MNQPYRRYEVLLPLQFNDGSAVPPAAIAASVQELEEQFSHLSHETQPIQGVWEHGGKSHRDATTRVFVDVPDTDENRHFFLVFKERLKERFHQHDIWISTHALEIL